MVTFPNAKINLGLNITEKRVDGFHNLETVFLPIDIKDALEIVVDNNNKGTIEFTSSGLQIVGDISQNLCIRAYKLLQKDIDLPAVKMHLHKTIPMGAGLGGGSADGAFALRLLNDTLHLNLPTNQLIKYALQLGSDCPFFIENQTCFATSRGEILNPIALDLSAYQIVIINPQIHIATAWAFSKVLPKKPVESIKKIIEQPVTSWKNKLQNDFEPFVLKEQPAVRYIKDTLYNYGAVYASLTGTGSTVFGIFSKLFQPADFGFPNNYFVKWVNTL